MIKNIVYKNSIFIDNFTILIFFIELIVLNYNTL